MAENENKTKCAYCRKVIEGTPHQSHIISRMWKPSYRSPARYYCDNTCASHDQMAHEG